MIIKRILFVLACCASPLLYAEQKSQVQHEIQNLQKHAQELQAQLEQLQKEIASQKIKMEHQRSRVKTKTTPHRETPAPKAKALPEGHYHLSHITIHTPEGHPESIGFYPTALVADDQVVAYIAGTPVVSSPYLGDRPAFDGSDYIVNISSINRDIRLMQQRRKLYRAYESIGYPVPQRPIIALSGKTEPVGVMDNPFRGNTDGDLTLGTSELDVAAALNDSVEAYIAIAYDASPPEIGPRIDNSAFNLNMGFVNIGNLDRSPLYFTAGQVYVPFGRYSSSMISAPLTMDLGRTKTRPFILGYKSQEDVGPFGAVYIYKSDTTLGKSGVGGVNLGYVFEMMDATGEVGASFISSIDDAAGMQSTAATVGTIFGGFGSITNGSELVRKTQAVDVHANLSIDRYSLTAEWVGTTQPFRFQDLSFNGKGARPQAAQGEAGMTFRAFNRPSSIGLGYQWSRQALALNLPKRSVLGVFNISIWKDTVESIEFRHDLDYGAAQVGNGAAPPGFVNLPTVGTGKTAETISAQIGVYF